MNAKELNNFLKKQGLEVLASSVYETRDKYFDPHNVPDKETRKEWTNYCSELIEAMIVNGATSKELEKAIIFSKICIDSIKYQLSIIKAYKELKICDLEEKYVQGVKNS